MSGREKLEGKELESSITSRSRSKLRKSPEGKA